MWSKTQNRVNLELAMLRQLLESYSVLRKVQSSEPDETELVALAAILHSFYGGIENIFKRIALEIDFSVPSGMFSHSDLLNQMARSIDLRPVIISEELRQRLNAYLDFRHVFRHAYAFDLKWRKMRDLVLQCEETLDRLDSELQAFFGTASP